MSLSERDQLAAIHCIEAAVLEPAQWNGALRYLTKAAGGVFGQALGVNLRTGIQFNFFSEELPSHLATEFELRGGHSPDVNPRARILFRPTLRVGTERDLATPEELADSEFMQDFIYASGSADMCSVRLPDIGDTRIAAAVSRSSRQEFTVQRLEAFGSLLPHFSAALRLRATLDQDSARLAAGTMDAISCAAFILDSGKNIVALSRHAEAMLAESTFLTARRGQLSARVRRYDPALQVAIAKACSRWPTLDHSQAASVVIGNATGRVRIAEVAPLHAQQFSLRFGPVAVVALERERPPPDVGRALNEIFGLTTAEIEITVQMLEGLSTAAIAQTRHTSVQTVRTQLKAVFGKLDVGSRTELMHKLMPFIQGRL